MPVYEKFGDVRAKAIAKGQIADILEARGQYDEALRIRRLEEMLVYEKHGDIRSKSTALFKIARIELARNQPAEAFRHLSEAYGIAENLRIPDGLAAVGELYGELLLQCGEQEKGLAVLNTALQAAIQLGWNENANRLRELINQLHAVHDSGS
ncbi:hypothetical protein [Methylomagnum sp.]